MARPRKQGLDYFNLGCQLDEKMRLIQAQFGLKGFALVVKLLQKIYGEYGYYCEWTEDAELVFIAENLGASKDGANFVAEVLKACIKRGIFSEDLFGKYGILTSSEIQKNFAEAVKKREQVEMKKEYLLIKVAQKSIKLTKTGVSDAETGVFDGINPQSKVEVKDILNTNAFNISSKHASVREVERVFFEDKLLNKAFIDYIEYRKAVKYPLTQKGIDISLKKLKELSKGSNDMAIKILEQSIVKNWKDLYPISETKEQKTNEYNYNSEYRYKRSKNRFNDFQQRPITPEEEKAFWQEAADALMRGEW